MIANVPKWVSTDRYAIILGNAEQRFTTELGLSG
jgi:hypothetical protein